MDAEAKAARAAERAARRPRPAGDDAATTTARAVLPVLCLAGFLVSLDVRVRATVLPMRRISRSFFVTL